MSTNTDLNSPIISTPKLLEAVGKDKFNDDDNASVDNTNLNSNKNGSTSNNTDDIVKDSLDKENETNGDIYCEKSSKIENETKGSVLLCVDLNVKSKEDDEDVDNNLNKDQTKKEDESIKNITEQDDNAVDIEIKNEAEEMEIKDEVENDANFAIICSFLERFSEALEIKYSIKHLKAMFEDYSKVRPDLIDLHIKLLRKRRKYINKEKWEIALVRFCAEYSNIDSWELERFGYQNAKLSLRLRIFVRLLEAMFDYNQKFKSELNANNDASSLRIPSFGRDIIGYTYWYQVDSDLNFRLYKEEPDDEGSWSLVSRNLNEFNDCIQDLEQKTTVDLKTEFLSNSDESNSNQAMLLLMKSKENLLVKDEDVELNEDIEEMEVDEKCKESPIKVEDPSEERQKLEKKDIPKEREANNDDVLIKENILSDVKVKEEINDTTIQEVQDSKCCINKEVDILLEEMLDNVQSKFINADSDITSLCQELINKVENDLNEKIDLEEESTPSTRTTKRKGRSKRRRALSTPRNKKEKNDQNHQNENVKQNDEETGKNLEQKNEAKETPKNQGRRRRSELEKLREDFTDELTTKRSSRRIQALQQKKLAEIQEEQKRLEKEMQEKSRKKKAANAAKAAALLAASFSVEKSNESSDNRKSKKRRKKKDESDEEYYQKESEEEILVDKKKKKRRRGKGKRRKGNNPWEGSDDSEDENPIIEDEYDDILDEDDNEELKFDENNNEDEFACEEEDPNAEPVIVRRARTVKKSKDDFNDNDLEPVVNDDKPCGRCGKYDNPQWILLCDNCDEGFHTACLRPPLFIIPTGDWFCPPCEHKKLICKLNEEYKRLEEEFERIENEKQKKKKQWKYQYCDISSENIIEGGGGGDNIANDDETNRNVKNSRKNLNKKRRQNGYIKDEIEDALQQYDEYSDEEGEDEDDNRDRHSRRRNRSDSDVEDSSDGDDDSEENSSSSDSDDDDDEIGQLAFSDDDRSHRNKQKKHKRVDINDYSRSGLKLRSARKRKPISYLFKEYDDMIKSAILQESDPLEEGAYPAGDEEEELEDEENADGVLPRSKGKDISNILKANSEIPDFTINPFDSGKSTTEINEVVSRADVCVDGLPDSNKSVPTLNSELSSKPKDELSTDSKPVVNDDLSDNADEVIGSKKKLSNQIKKKKLTTLDFSTDDDDGDHASDEDFNMGEADDDDLDEELTEVEDDNDDAVTDSDSDFKASTRRSSRRSTFVSFRSKKRKNKKKNKKKKKNNKRRGFLVDSDEDLTSEDDDEDDEDEESYSDESSDYEPRKRRRAVSNKRVSYREESTTEEEETIPYNDDDDFDEEEEDEGYRKKKSKLAKVTPKSKSPKKRGKKRIIQDDYSDEYNSNQSEPEQEPMSVTKKIKIALAETLKKESAKKSESSKSGKVNLPNQPAAAPSSPKPPASIAVSKSSGEVATPSTSQATLNENKALETVASSVVAPTTTPSHHQSAPVSSSQPYPSCIPVSFADSNSSVDPLNSMKQMNSKLDYNASPNVPPSSSPSVLPQRPQTPQSPYANHPYPGAPPNYPHSYHHPPPSPTATMPHQYPPNPSMPPPHPTAPYPPHSNSHHYSPLPPQQFMPPMGGHRMPGPTPPIPPPPNAYPPHIGPPGPPQQIPPGQYHSGQPSPRHNLPPSTSAYHGSYGPPPHPQHQHYPPPAPSQIQPRSSEKGDEDYTLTNLDSFKPSRPSPVKPPVDSSPSPYGPNFPPPPSTQPPSSNSPPQILNLDSGTTSASFPSYPTPPVPHNKPHYYPPQPGFETGARLPPPPNYSYPHHPSQPGPVFYPPGPGAAHSHIHGMPYGHPIPPPQNIAPYHPPGANTQPNFLSQRTPSPRQQSPSSSPAYSANSTPNAVPVGTVPSPHGQNASKGSGPMLPPSGAFPPGPHPNYPYQQYPPPPPLQGQSPYPSPNGGFMIQNLLLNRPQESVCAVKSAPKSTKSTPKAKTAKSSNTKEVAAEKAVKAKKETAKTKATKSSKKSKTQSDSQEGEKKAS